MSLIQLTGTKTINDRQRHNLCPPNKVKWVNSSINVLKSLHRLIHHLLGKSWFANIALAN